MILGRLLTVSLIFTIFNVFANDFHPNHLIVKFKTNNHQIDSKLIQNKKHLYGNVYLLITKDTDQLINSLDKSQFDFIEKDTVTSKNKLPEATPARQSFQQMSSMFNDPMTSSQWLLADGSSNGISQESAYRNRRGGEQQDIIVAVVDTGVDYNHEDLKDVMWTNTREIAGNGIDDDNNGYIDDIHGISTLKRDENGNATGDITPVHSHGTHVSGIIAAKQNNNIGIAGVSNHVRIMGIQSVPANGDEIDSDVIESFIYAAKNGARIINCSFGKSKMGTEKAVSDAIDFISKTYGVLVIASAGNDSRNIDQSRNFKYPANLQNESLLVVASSTQRGRLSYFSNYGLTNVDLAAPGSNIYSTVPGNKYANMSGTSMSSPVVSGVAAEVLSANPGLNAIELKDRLMNTVTEKQSWRSKMQAPGIINLDTSLNN